MMEEPTGWLFPDEVGRLCKMVRLTMERAGFPEGRFLVHIHWYLGLAEAVQPAALCNGAGCLGSCMQDGGADWPRMLDHDCHQFVPNGSRGDSHYDEAAVPITRRDIW
jgi:hypothetical protein